MTPGVVVTNERRSSLLEVKKSAFESQNEDINGNALSYYHVPDGFAVGAEPVRRPGEAPREGVSSKNGWGWGGIMREIGALVQGDGWV